MRLTRALLCLLILVPAAGSAVAQSLESDLQGFESWVTAEMKEDRMPGLSVAVFREGELWTDAYGFADLENQVPAKPESSYRMASVTKPMTAVAALRLAEMGKLDLDAPIQKYVDYFPEKGAPITIRRLLAHLGGISHYRNYSVEGHIREPKTTREAIAIFEGFDLVAPPGERYSYSSYGYNLVGAALETAAGMPYGKLMRELVWEPAGMDDTRMDDPEAIIPNRVEGYRLDDGELKNSEYVDVSSRFAGGGTRSTVIDMVRFARALDEGELLARESLDMMWWPQTTNAGRWSSYGLGWDVHAINGRFQVNHSGSQQETRTLLVMFPADDIVIALASNFEDATFGKYLDRIVWELTGEVWDPAKYAGDRRDALARELAENVFDAGRLYFEKYGHAMTTDARELDAAFAELRRTAAKIETDPDAAAKEIADGIHPASGQPWLTAGSWIAARLESADEERWHHLGELAFLEDWVARYRRDRDVPRSRRLPERFERRIVALSDEWEEVFTPAVAEMMLDGAAAAERLAEVMPRDARILPSLANELVAAVETSFQAGDIPQAREYARLAAELYPNDSEATGVQGVVLSLTGQQAEGLPMLERSVRLDPRGYGRAGNLRSIASYVAEAGFADSAVALLENAAAVHENDATVHAALGGLYAKQGEVEKARAAYERALEIDSSSEQAQKGLRELAGG